MHDEMEPTLRMNTANATMRKATFAINTANKGVCMVKGYVFHVYLNGDECHVGVYNADKTGSKSKCAWKISDLETGLAISRGEHKTRKKALETFFNGYEFDSWAKIVDKALTDLALGKRNWYLEKSEDFTIAVRRAGYRKEERGLMHSGFGW